MLSNWYLWAFCEGDTVAATFPPEGWMKPRRLPGMAVGLGVLMTAFLLLQGCGFGDLFRSAGLRDVVIQYEGDSIFAVGDSLPFAFTVSANGVTLTAPALTVESSDTTILTFTAGRDSLIGVSNGTVTLTARLIDPAFTDSMPTGAVRVRVRGGGP